MTEYYQFSKQIFPQRHQWRHRTKFCYSGTTVMSVMLNCEAYINDIKVFSAWISRIYLVKDMQAMQMKLIKGFLGMANLNAKEI